MLPTPHGTDIARRRKRSYNKLSKKIDVQYELTLPSSLPALKRASSAIGLHCSAHE